MAADKKKLKVPRSGPSERVAEDANGRMMAQFAEDGVRWVKVGGFDIDGVLRGKYISIEKLRSALAGGFGFCDVIFGWDVADQLYDNAEVTGWHTGFPDVQAVIDPTTARAIPWEPGVVSLLCDFYEEPGVPHRGCPRSLLQRVLKYGSQLGYQAKVGVEFEFFFFRESRESLAEKGYRGLTPLDPGMMGYSWVRTGQDSELMRDILDTMDAYKIEIEGLHTETGPGVYEVALRYDDALVAADKAALFKTVLKQIAPRHGLSVTFMAKNDVNLPGSSGHLHQSLWSRGKNVFASGRGRKLGAILSAYVGGQMALLPEFTAMMSPTINSYKRYVPGLWAPLSATWGVENRTCALRVISPDSRSAARVECRQGAADINPYIAMAASLGAGLWGIEKSLQPGPESKGDASEAGHMFPSTLASAAQQLSKSRAARRIFGSPFVEHYVRTRQWEVSQFERAVTDWECRRYFEMV